MIPVRIEEVTAGYGGAPVLRDLSLEVAPGEVVAVLGASGSGKSTLLRVLAGFLRPTAGQVWFGDREVSGPGTWVPPEQRRVGIVPQEGALFPHLDVAGNIGFGLPRGSRTRVDEMLRLVGLAGLGRARPQELSGGQQQRVAVARALAPGPDVLCLDEPFSALDASLRGRLRAEVRDVLDLTGTTTILVTHDQEEALSIADRVAVVRDGTVVQVARPADLYERPVDLTTARFVGDAVELDARASADGWVTCALGEVRVPEARTGASGLLVLRPEQLGLVAESEGAGALGTVRARSYHGHDCVLLVRLDAGAEVPVRVPGSRSAEPGDRVGVVVDGGGRLFAQPDA